MLWKNQNLISNVQDVNNDHGLNLIKDIIVKSVKVKVINKNTKQINNDLYNI